MDTAAPAEWVDVTTLIPWEDNPYDHPPEQVDDIARSITANGWGDVIVAHLPTRRIVSGHGRRLAALQLIEADAGWTLADAPSAGAVPVRWVRGEWEDVCEALAIAANETARNADRRESKLAEVLERLRARREAGAVVEHGVRDAEVRRLLAARRESIVKPEGDEGAPPTDTSKPPDSVLGTVYELGPHRLLCGDSTDAALVSLLFGDESADLVHADPPYGMGKESDGVLNDNLYRERLDAFQMKWWRIWRAHLNDNGSAYIWGNAEDLWRLWFAGDGLAASETLALKNEIVWDKGSGMGMASSVHRMFATATERCLFFMLGAQQMGPMNKDDYWEGWEPLRAYLCEQRDLAGWTNSDVNRITGTHMAGHWFGKSQWTMISKAHYETLHRESGGAAFLRPYEAAKGEHLAMSDEFAPLRDAFNSGRCYFDGSWEPMTDVWRFGRVLGDERHGHATPKPVVMIERAVRSSCPLGGIVAEPFGGSGSTLIAAAQSGRRCFTAELSPAYCDVIRRRWTRWAIANGEDPGPGALHD